jgi:chemotaxis protein CheC
MTIDVSMLSEIEQDVIAEIANMGVSRAANSLRQMVGHEVLLSVPAVNVVTREAAARLVERGSSSKLVAVQQSFEGPFSGRALLIFPEVWSWGARSWVTNIRLRTSSTSNTRRSPRPAISS